MIDKHYIDSAIRIRKEYLNLTNKLESCKREIEKISEDLLTETDILDKLNDNLKQFKTPEEAQEAVFKQLSKAEVHTERINEIYKPIETGLDELKKQEEILYNNIKRSYPELSDKEIVEEINKYITK